MVELTGGTGDSDCVCVPPLLLLHAASVTAAASATAVIVSCLRICSIPPGVLGFRESLKPVRLWFDTVSERATKAYTLVR